MGSLMDPFKGTPAPIHPRLDGFGIRGAKAFAISAMCNEPASESTVPRRPKPGFRVLFFFYGPFSNCRYSGNSCTRMSLYKGLGCKPF